MDDLFKNIDMIKPPSYIGGSAYSEYSTPLITSPINSTWAGYGDTLSLHIEPFFKLEELEKREYDKMNISEYEHIDHFTNTEQIAVTCKDEKDLQQNTILKCLFVMKTKLMLKCAPFHVKNIECKMTPAVKQNIIMAYKKLEMYGKKSPFIARFDEYGKRLPDEIRIDTMKGMDIKIVDPESYGNFYIEFNGIIKKSSL